MGKLAEPPLGLLRNIVLSFRNSHTISNSSLHDRSTRVTTLWPATDIRIHSILHCVEWLQHGIFRLPVLFISKENSTSGRDSPPHPPLRDLFVGITAPPSFINKNIFPAIR